MKFLKVLLVFVLISAFLLNCTGSFAQEIGKKKVFIKVDSVEWSLIDPVTAYLNNRLRMLGYEVVRDKALADYVIALNIVDISHQRRFNWFFLLLPLWPIVPITIVEGEATVEMQFLDSSGKEILFNQVKCVKKGNWVLGDFVSPESVIKDATLDCVSRLVVKIAE